MTDIAGNAIRTACGRSTVRQWAGEPTLMRPGRIRSWADPLPERQLPSLPIMNRQE
jgi:hypothetical protein